MSSIESQRLLSWLARSLLMSTLGLSSQLTAGDWRGTLEDGAGVEVDPSTHKAWRTEQGVRTPLWDGAHRLDDGSVIIVREGTAVPSEVMLDQWSQTSEPAQPPMSSPCYELIDKVCGVDFRCSTAEPCRLANELMDMAREEQRRGPAFQAQASSSDQCREAMANPFFAPCD